MKPEVQMNEEKTKYLNSVMEKLRSGGEGLTDIEKSLGGRYEDIQRKVSELNAQANNLDNEIKFKSNQLESLRDEIKTEFGRAGGIMDAMVALWDGPKTITPGNGATIQDRPSGKAMVSEEKTDA